MKKQLLILFISIFLIGIINASLINYSSTNLNTTLNSNLTSYYKFDEGTGTNVSDLIRGYNGVFFEPLWATGKLSNAGKFNGTNYVTTSAIQILQNVTNFTFGGWLNSSANNIDYEGVYVQSGGTFNGFSLYQLGGKFVCMYGNLTTASWNEVTSTTSILNNTWYNVYCSKNLTNFNIYVNGILENSTIVSSGAISVPTLAFNLGSVGYKGIIDEFGIWNKSLSDTEINQSLYNLGNGCAYQNNSCWNITYDYLVYENSRTHNTSTFETASEIFSINVTANSSLTGVSLIYDGVAYTMTNNSGIWSKTLSINSTMIGTNSFNYKFTYGSDTFYSTNSSQIVNELVFTICNATYTTKFLNISFQDESTLNYTNASIPLSYFYYWINDSTLNKTYSFSNNSINYNYTFCSNATSNLKVVPYLQYKNGTTYPQRIWNPSVQTYNSTITNQILYLLSSTEGIYVTFQVTNPSNQVISGVTINASREISGGDVLVAQGVTGDDGTVTFWLNPDYTHEFYFIKSGFTTLVTSITPTQSSYTVVIGGSSATQIVDYSQGMDIKINPKASVTLLNNSVYGFNMTISSSYWDLDAFGIIVKLNNGTILGSTVSTSSSGGIVNVNVNTTDYKRIYMEYYYTVNGTNKTDVANWIVINSLNTEYSILYLVNDFKAYFNTDIFGLDNFGRTLIIFLILFLSLGIMNYKFGMTSPMAIMLMAFIMIYLFDVVFGLLPNPYAAIPNFFTWLIGLITAVVVIKEVIQ